MLPPELLFRLPNLIVWNCSLLRTEITTEGRCNLLCVWEKALYFGAVGLALCAVNTQSFGHPDKIGE